MLMEGSFKISETRLSTSSSRAPPRWVAVALGSFSLFCDRGPLGDLAFGWQQSNGPISSGSSILNSSTMWCDLYKGSIVVSKLSQLPLLKECRCPVACRRRRVLDRTPLRRKYLSVVQYSGFVDEWVIIVVATSTFHKLFHITSTFHIRLKTHRRPTAHTGWSSKETTRDEKKNSYVFCWLIIICVLYSVQYSQETR